SPGRRNRKWTGGPWSAGVTCSPAPFPARADALQEARGSGYPNELDSAQGLAMKPNIHPEYREDVFQDANADFAFLTRSTIQTKDTIVWVDGKEYPLLTVEVPSKSHPFYTGKHKTVESGGRVDKFRRRYAGKRPARAAAAWPSAPAPSMRIDPGARLGARVVAFSPRAV